MRKYNVFNMFQHIMAHGYTTAPNEEIILEIPYFQCIVTNPWSTYPERRYPMDYFKREMQWYLGADPYDDRICKHAAMWGKLRQEDGSILSNYGQYWFGKQNGFQWVVDKIRSDPDTRQAYIAYEQC